MSESKRCPFPADITLYFHRTFLEVNKKNPVEVLNEHLLLLVGRFVPTKIIRVCNKDKPWFEDEWRHAFGLKQELIFGGPVLALGLTRKRLPTVK